jgi:hypothetical protein
MKEVPPLTPVHMPMPTFSHPTLSKLSNVLLNCCTGEGMAVVDLDTCMPGTPLYDFGDMVRSSVCLCAEDEQDLRQVVFRPQVTPFTTTATTTRQDELPHVSYITSYVSHVIQHVLCLTTLTHTLLCVPSLHYDYPPITHSTHPPTMPPRGYNRRPSGVCSAMARLLARLGPARRG